MNRSRPQMGTYSDSSFRQVSISADTHNTSDLALAKKLTLCFVGSEYLFKRHRGAWSNMNILLDFIYFKYFKYCNDNTVVSIYFALAEFPSQWKVNLLNVCLKKKKKKECELSALPSSGWSG